MKIIYLILVLFAFACKPAQNITTRDSENQKTHVNNDVNRVDSVRIEQMVKKGIQTAFKQHLNVTIVTTAYDTGKEIVKGTDKPPVKFIKRMTLEAQKEGTGVDSSTTSTRQKSASVVIDKSIVDSTRVSIDNKTTKGKIKGYQTFLMWCGGLVLLGLILYFGIKMGWKWLV